MQTWTIGKWTYIIFGWLQDVSLCHLSTCRKAPVFEEAIGDVRILWRSSSLYYMIQGFTMGAQMVRSFIAIPLQKCPDSAQKGLKLRLERSANYWQVTIKHVRQGFQKDDRGIKVWATSVKSEASVRGYLLQMLRSETYGSRLQFPSTQLHHRLGCYL